MTADTAYAQTYRFGAPTADDSWETGHYGSPRQVQPGDVIEAVLGHSVKKGGAVVLDGLREVEEIAAP